MSDRDREHAAAPDPALVHLRQAGVRLARLCRKHFRIVGSGDRLQADTGVGERDVLAFLLEYGASIRPVGLSARKAFPHESTELTTFLWTTPTPDSVLNDVVRLSLYTDRTVLVDPFSRHVAGAPYRPAEAGPFSEPARWVQYFVNWALMVCALEPWIDAGMVVLIPEPQNFLKELPSFEAMAGDAMSHGLFSGLEDRTTKDMLEAAALTSVDDRELRAVVHLTLPDLEDPELDEVVAALSAYRVANPTRYVPSRSEYASLITSGGGQNIFEAAWIAESLGGYLVPRGHVHTELFRRVSRGPENDDRDALVTAFAAAPLPMLNNVSLPIALSMRKTARLESFRHYLREVWSETTSVDAGAKSPDRARDLAERLVVEHERAAEDWAAIYKDLGVMGAAMLFAGPVATVVDARFLLGVAGVGLKTLTGWSSATRAHRRNPAALIVELENESSPNPLRHLAAKLERHA